MSDPNPLWGGHYAAGPAAIMAEINTSIDADKRLYRQDIAASQAHAAMLAKCGILTAEDAGAIAGGLDAILAEIEGGSFVFDRALEDIHMNVEARLATLIGAPAGRLHTARSRNDQVATDFRLWLRDALDQLDLSLAALQAALVDRAEEYAATSMPGYTHLQAAQPITFGHHLMAYVEMLGRDRGRLRDCRARLNESPLGSAALAGTSFPIDRRMTAQALGFDRPMANSLDGVSARDFALEFLAAASICGTHLSRFGEEMVLWTSPQYGFVTLSEAFTTGSSIMPQKRNPDAAELVRAKSGSLTGAFVALSTMMKGLPLAYAKDMQEDKPPVFAAVDTLQLVLAACTGMVRDMQARPHRMQEALKGGYITATDLADWLVRTLDLPFRQAHHVTGRIVRLAEEEGCELHELPLTALQQAEPRITNDVFRVLTPENAIASRTSFGGTSPLRVREAVASARMRFALETRKRP